MINGLFTTQLKIIENKRGNILHSIKNTDSGFNGFGEAYFSEIVPNAIKAWKMHKLMTLNLTVPFGKVKFVMFDDRNNEFEEIIISDENYVRLTVPPLIWVGFQGLSNNKSLILNIADIPHDPNESISKDLDEIFFTWSK